MAARDSHVVTESVSLFDWKYRDEKMRGILI